MLFPFRLTLRAAVGALLLAACGTESEAPNTGALSGRVTLAGSTETLEGSVVAVGKVATLTGEDGAYTLEGLTPGEVTVRVSREGFVAEEETVTVNAGEVVTFDVELSRTNEAPTLSAVSAAPTVLLPSGTAALLASAQDADGDALTYEWSADNGFTVASGEAGAATLTAPDEVGTAGTVTVVVKDGRGGQASAQLQVSTRGNLSPVLSSLTATPPLVLPGQTVTLTAGASDEDGHSLLYSWTAPDGWTLSGEGATVQLQAPAEYGLSAQVDVEVSDGHGGTALGQITVGTSGSRAPVISSLSATPAVVQKGGTVTLKANAADPDGDALAFTWTAPTGWTLTPDGDTAVLLAPATPDASAVIELLVEDGFGQSAQAMVTVATLPNVAPVISNLAATPAQAEPGGQLTLTASVSDADTDPLTYAWSVDDAAWTVTGSGASATVTAPYLLGHTAQVTLEVTDGLGGVTTATLPVSTRPSCTWMTTGYAPIAAESLLATEGESVAQTITLASSASLNDVVLPLYMCKSNGLLDAQVRITGVTATGLPDDANVLATSALVPSADIPSMCTGGNHFGPITFTFAVAPELLAGTPYAVVLDVFKPAGTVGSAGMYWRRSSTPTDPSNPYLGGAPYFESDLFGWTPSNSALDLAFTLNTVRCGSTP